MTTAMRSLTVVISGPEATAGSMCRRSNTRGVHRLYAPAAEVYHVPVPEQARGRALKELVFVCVEALRQVAARHDEAAHRLDALREAAVEPAELRRVGAEVAIVPQPADVVPVHMGQRGGHVLPGEGGDRDAYVADAEPGVDKQAALRALEQVAV